MQGTSHSRCAFPWKTYGKHEAEVLAGQRDFNVKAHYVVGWTHVLSLPKQWSGFLNKLPVTSVTPAEASATARLVQSQPRNNCFGLGKGMMSRPIAGDGLAVRRRLD
ncbi:hypothetical protein AV530_001579 [Patagioenas fasciata monilis]|uniref:Uncharacterized protein n=1 Tax=Patagioenas fasciata monilis TaxID=372326 RepID=A0A1V4K5I8_PATFA|nr:hypothetical protein AV530_001579 [Patagioenas fasciata monilis]